MSQFLSLSAVSRKLDLPYPRALRLLRQHVLVPDSFSGKVALFAEERLPELQRAVVAAGKADTCPVPPGKNGEQRRI